MTAAPAFARAADIEASLEALAEVCEDPTPVVYKHLFAAHPTMQPYFWRDTNGAIKGEMLSRTFEAILDFVGERRYAQHMISTELVTHEGYEVPREVFVTFFGIIRDAARELLGADWTPAFEEAWTTMLAEMDAYARATPRSDATNAYFAAKLEEFTAPYAKA
ncbi:MAG: globin [Phenylobacterium sp.]|uniref:globin n=1 Tax=Phenylobacterium sp. TaxID=1871053 RepID=UPI001A428D2A|nr:globin [Phenylobacterium sp.]MBL8553623.1 globin [Phenylobacterium sp.]